MAIEYLDRKTYDLARAHGYELIGRLGTDLYYVHKTPSGRREKLTGFMRSDGTMLFEPVFIEFSSADKDMLMCRREDGLWGVVSKEGVQITDFIYEEMDGRYEFGRLMAKRNDLWGYLDKKGEVAIPFRYEIAAPFIKRVAIVQEGGKLKAIGLRGETASDESLAKLNAARAAAHIPPFTMS
ncbi:MAG: WG repeat-containing protein [Alistipes sp.]|nr:WG repeat-containing protein [Alistipes sp.]